MSVATLSNHYGAQAYASAANGKADNSNSSCKENESTKSAASDSVELSQAAQDHINSPRVDDVLDDNFDPPVALDGLDDEISVAKKQLLEMVEAAKASSGMENVNITSDVVAGRLVTFSVVMESGYKPELTQLKNGTYADMNFVPDNIKGYTDQNYPESEPESQAAKVYHDEMKAGQYVDKFQRLAVLNAISTMSKNNDTFRTLYQSNPFDALSQFRGEIADLTSRFSLNHDGGGGTGFFVATDAVKYNGAPKEYI